MAPFTHELWLKDDHLIISIDIGTTFTAVSYSHLYTNGPMEVKRVGKWPGLPEQRGLTKIPSLVYYNRRQEATVFGAEALSAEVKEDAEEQGWGLAQHFKLHLHPYELRTKHMLETTKLPHGLTVERVYADFLVYLMAHTRQFFTMRTTNGAKVWSDLNTKSSIVLTHPNAWGLKEQAVLRRAAIQADLVTKADAHRRIQFVTEGEASVHYCLYYGNFGKTFRAGSRFIVCDVGGSTVDTTAYVAQPSESNLLLEEAKPSGCVQAGGIFVNQQALNYLSLTLSRSSIPRDVLNHWIMTAMDDFEITMKPEFPRSNGRYTLSIDRNTVNEPELGIKRGRLKLEYDTIASFFAPSLEKIKSSMTEQLSGFQADHIFLVGGYGESPYLRQEVKRSFENSKCQVTALDDGTAKAVSDGAVIWLCMNQVEGRRARFSIGAAKCQLYDPEDEEQAGRTPKVFADGQLYITHYWTPIITTNQLVKGTKYSEPLRDCADTLEAMNSFSWELFSYHGANPGTFLYEPSGRRREGFKRLCTVAADLRKIAVKRERPGNNGSYYTADAVIGMDFSSTEIKAFLHWKENGKYKRSRAEIILH